MQDAAKCASHQRARKSTSNSRSNRARSAMTVPSRSQPRRLRSWNVDSTRILRPYSRTRCRPAGRSERTIHGSFCPDSQVALILSQRAGARARAGPRRTTAAQAVGPGAGMRSASVPSARAAAGRCAPPIPAAHSATRDLRTAGPTDGRPARGRPVGCSRRLPGTE